MAKKINFTKPIMNTQYQKELQKYNKLTPEEEIALYEAFQAGDQKTKDRFATSVLRYAYSVAQKFFGGVVESEELISAANEGVMEALVRFKPEKGNRFVTYANIWILNKIRAAIDEQKKQNGYKDSEGNYYRAVQSLDRNFGLTDGEDDVDEHERVHSDYSDELTDRMFLNLDLPLLHKCLDKLNEKERDVIKLYFGLVDLGKDDISLEEIGEMYGLSKERIRQIRNTGIEKITRMMGGESSLAA